MRIGVIGAGALGCLFGGLLKRAGNEVVLVHQDPLAVSLLRRKGVKIHSKAGKALRVRTEVELAPADLTDCELVLITVKAYDTQRAARLHRGCLQPGSQIVSLQNGLGNVETLGAIFQKQVVLAALTTEASLSLGPGRVIHTGKGETRLGRPDGKITVKLLAIVKEFRKAGFKSEPTLNISGAIWSKAIVNAALNPASALTGLPNGRLAKVPLLRETMLKVIGEGVSVSRAEKQTPFPEPRNFLFKILRNTAANSSSMLQDIQRGRRTEILQLNGAISRLGDLHNISTPTNKTLTSLVLGLEAALTHPVRARGKNPGIYRVSASDHRFSKASAKTLIIPRLRV